MDRNLLRSVCGVLTVVLLGVAASSNVYAIDKNNRYFAYGVGQKSCEDYIKFREKRLEALEQEFSAIMLSVCLFGCSEPLSTREKGAVIGTVGGAGLGGIIGAAAGNAGAGAGIGAAVGLLGGALIGDQMQARQEQEEDLQRRLQAQQAEIDRQQRELDQIKRQQAR